MITFSDLIAILALILSIVSILIQNFNNQQQLKIANIIEYTKRYQEIIKELPKSILNPTFDITQVEELEQERILRLIWVYFDMCYEQYAIYYELKLIDKKLWNMWRSGMVAACSRTSFQQCWALIAQNSRYPKKFSLFIQSLMK